MLAQNYAEASVEVLDILNHMNASDLSKVSKKFIDFLKQNSSKQYRPNLDYSKSLNNMNLKKETRGLLAIMYRSYWCSEEEKQNLQRKLYENEKKHQEELREKYIPENLFKTNSNNRKIRQNEEVVNTSNLPIEIKENLFTKVINSIKRFLHLK